MLLLLQLELRSEVASYAADRGMVASAGREQLVSDLASFLVDTCEAVALVIWVVPQDGLEETVASSLALVVSHQVRAFLNQAMPAGQGSAAGRLELKLEVGPLGLTLELVLVVACQASHMKRQ